LEKYEVYTAPRRQNRSIILKDIKPAIILLDLDMPEMNGYGAIKIIKAGETAKDIPVIFPTAKRHGKRAYGP
jgi:DNA-binding response OmpR family regulator